MKLKRIMKQYPFIQKELSRKLGKGEDWITKLTKANLSHKTRLRHQQLLTKFFRDIGHQLSQQQVNPENLTSVVQNLRTQYAISKSAVATQLNKSREWIDYIADSPSNNSTCRQNCQKIQEYLNNLGHKLKHENVTI